MHSPIYVQHPLPNNIHIVKVRKIKKSFYTICLALFMLHTLFQKTNTLKY